MNKIIYRLLIVFTLYLQTLAINKVEYNNIKQRLKEHLASVDPKQITDDYIVNYLTKIGSPEALHLLEDYKKINKYGNELDQLFKERKHDQAIGVCNAGLAIDENNAIFWERRGTAYFSLKNFNQALQDHTKAITIYPSAGFYYSARALDYYALGNMQAALSDFRTAASLGEPEAQRVVRTLSQPYSETMKDQTAHAIAMRFTATSNGGCSSEFEQRIRSAM